ncbi:hypothetical protein ASF63_08210 [Microbacterium sp. Leaf320]|nr:hypothetical protein ASF63_08210 [Microbacterium sp. Leaf320]
MHTKITRKGSGDVTVLFCRSPTDRATPAASEEAAKDSFCTEDGRCDLLTIPVITAIVGLRR